MATHAATVQTGNASQIVALLAAVATAGTARQIAGLARAGTIAANRFFTALTAVAFILIDRLAAVVTTDSIPIGQLHEGPTFRVRMQQLIYDRKEIQQPSLPQRRADGQPAISFTERFVADVRMRDAVIGTGWIRVQRRDTVVGCRMLPFPA